ncbi:MAG TPA: bifunctional phosphoribosylaminoimidazolecarboxamide formyltransferase/IMP cyclohydrolase [Pirellulales bacterium]|jgi:phosphoribosylaminoimidazolecarboxamide formyltransferase/IMP cyclohydrolase|nr:bifunctional phosphoribosylaminoimidazolecarboxamide formyltransferase/IMP cyclohydrolase [Pirellulales bacterium]
MPAPPIRRAIISVSDKLGLSDFARGLVAAGVEIYTTGGTRAHLEKEGLAVHDVSAYTGFPEMMDGRLKTLHPKVFGGILGRHDRPDDMAALKEHGISTFELVVVNLYPFAATIARPGVTPAEAIEQIDIGGPSLVRAAAKNHLFTTIATSPEQYAGILTQIKETGATTEELRRRLAGEAFQMTARYDRTIADYFGKLETPADFPAEMNLLLRRKAILRYGENPHQPGALYASGSSAAPSLVAARQLNGKELSYNNLLDLDSALAMVRSAPAPAAAVIKHNNPCGAATAAELADALRRGLAGDPQSAFGSVIAVNRPVDAAAAEVLCEPGLFIEAIAAPSFETAAIELLTTKPKWKDNVRLMEVGQLEGAGDRWQLRAIEGGFLVQAADSLPDPESEWQVVTATQPTAAQWNDLRFAWSIVRYVKSNAIVLAKEETLWGVGAGQMSRVDSVEIAIHKAGERARGAALGSDAFFPFPDSIERAAAAGVAAVIQPGGSKKDPEVIAACDRHQIAMILTGRRHFKH